MIIQKVSMCRETRNLLNDFDSIAVASGITMLVTPKLILDIELMMMKYYYKPISNMIISKLKNISKKSSKHFTAGYWSQIIDNMSCGQQSVLRPDYIEYQSEITNSMEESFGYIIAYLITDYSISDAIMVQDMIRRYEVTFVHKAISTAKSNNVYNIHYIKAVIEKAVAISNIKVSRMQDLVNRAGDSASILNTTKVNNTPTDVVSNAENWARLIQQAEYMAQLDEIFKQ